MNLPKFSLFPAVLFLASQAATAMPVQISLTGEVDVGTDGVLGETGITSFDVGLTYDPSLAPAPEFVAVGTVLTRSSGDTTTFADDFYGYSVSGITDLNLTFGTKTWTVADIDPRILFPGISADIWFDKDLSSALPSRVWLFASNSGQWLYLGGITSGPIVSFVDPTRFEIDDADLAQGFVDAEDNIFTATRQSVAVPLPATLLLFGLGLAGLGFQRRKR